MSEEVVLITGASSGIGRACARLLHGAGYRVRGASRGRQAAGQEREPFETIQMDVDSDASVAAGVGLVLEREGRIDALINCAGYALAGPAEETSIAEVRAQLETNFFGSLRTANAVLPHMRERRRGRIINMGSIAGLVAVPFHAFYSASKFALEGWTEALRSEVRAHGIHVSLIEPGDYRTGFSDNRHFAAGSKQSKAYGEVMNRAVGVMYRSEQAAPPPDDIARLALKILRARSPRLRYFCGPWLQRITPPLRWLLPASLYEWSIRAYYGM